MRQGMAIGASHAGARATRITATSLARSSSGDQPPGLPIARPPCYPIRNSSTGGIAWPRARTSKQIPSAAAGEPYICLNGLARCGKDKSALERLPPRGARHPPLCGGHHTAGPSSHNRALG